MRTTIIHGLRAALLVAGTVGAFGARSSRPAPTQPRVVAISGVYTRASDDSGFRARVAAYDSLVELVVRGEGFAVVPHDTTDALEARLADSLGGVFDPVTGARDTARVHIIDAAVRRALRGRHGAELWLRSYIIVEGILFYGDEATWRGTTEKTGAAGGLGGVILGTKKGTIPALSLFVFVEDTTGATIYRGSGGIQLVMKAGGIGAKPKAVPMAQLLADPARNAHAVHYALDSLAARVGTQRALVSQARR